MDKNLIIPSQRRKGFHSSNEGFSLVEVLIAMVILAVAGLALLQLFQSSVLNAGKVTTKAMALRELQKNVSGFQADQYFPCDSNSKQNYQSQVSTDMSAERVVVDSVYGLVGGAWKDCSQMTSLPSGTIVILQKITFRVRYTEGTQNQYLTAVIYKTSTDARSLFDIADIPTSSLTLLSQNDLQYSTLGVAIVPIEVPGLSCRDAYLWSAVGVLSPVTTSLTNENCRDGKWELQISANRVPEAYPWPSTLSVAISGVVYSDKSVLDQKLANVTINFPAPKITDFSVTTPTGGYNCVSACPTAGLPGNSVTITGNYLLGSSSDPSSTVPSVTFSPGLSANVTANTDTSVIVTVPRSVTQGPISLTTNGPNSGTPIPAVSTKDFIVMPVVEFNENHYWTDDSGTLVTNSFQEQGASPNLWITVYTTTPANFISDVLFTSNVSAKALAWSSGTDNSTANQLQVQVPTGATKGPLKIVTGAGTSTSLNPFFPVPKINALVSNDAIVTPLGANGYGSGITGKSILIVGSGLLGISEVDFQNQSGDWIKASNCGYTGPRNFSDSFYFVDPATNIQKADTRVAVCVPSGAYTGKIRAINSIGEGISPWTFHPEPFVTGTLVGTTNSNGVSANGGGAGLYVTLNGSGFSNLTSLSFGEASSLSSTNSLWYSKSETKLILKIPSSSTSAQDGRIRITTSSGGNTFDNTNNNDASQFYVKPRIQSISSGSLSLGGNLTITGTGFSGTTAGGVLLNNAAATIVGTVSDSSISVKVPCTAATTSSASLSVTAPLGTGSYSGSSIALSGVTAALSSYGTNAKGNDSRFLASTDLQLTGTGFDCLTGISLSGYGVLNAKSTPSSTSMLVTLPASIPQTALISLVSANGYVNATNNFLWIAPNTTAVAFSPTTQSASLTSITVANTGTTRNPAYTATYKYTGTKPLFLTGEAISFSNSGTFYPTSYTVAAADNCPSSVCSFTYSFGSTNPGTAPTSSLGTISGKSALRGTTVVTITGKGFGGCQNGGSPTSTTYCADSNSSFALKVGTTTMSIDPTTFTDTTIKFTLPSSLSTTGKLTSGTLTLTTPYSSVPVDNDLTYWIV